MPFLKVFSSYGAAQRAQSSSPKSNLSLLTCVTASPKQIQRIFNGCSLLVTVFTPDSIFYMLEVKLCRFLTQFWSWQFEDPLVTGAEIPCWQMQCLEMGVVWKEPLGWETSGFWSYSALWRVSQLLLLCPSNVYSCSVLPYGQTLHSVEHPEWNWSNILLVMHRF